jgi:hypothetical protein
MKRIKDLFKENIHYMVVLGWFAIITIIAIIFSGYESYP